MLGSAVSVADGKLDCSKVGKRVDCVGFPLGCSVGGALGSADGSKLGLPLA